MTIGDDFQVTWPENQWIPCMYYKAMDEIVAELSGPFAIANGIEVELAECLLAEQFSIGILQGWPAGNA